MIVVKPMSGQTKIKVTGLYQWDKFQTLKFEDVYPSGTEVHFGIQGETVALVYLLENGSVRIPSVLLQRALPIMAWVHVGETTVLEIEMPVTSRAMPSDYIGIEDDPQHSIEYRTARLEQWQVEAIQQMSNRYTKAETDKQLELKADSNRVYTKAEANALLNEKADTTTVDAGLADRYTKAESDVLLNEKASVTELTEGLDARYTKTETDALLAGKANKAQGAWIVLTLGYGVTGEAKCRKNNTGQLEIVANLVWSDAPSASPVFIVPPDLRPSTHLAGVYYNATKTMISNFLVTSAGGLACYGPISPNDQIYLRFVGVIE